jgi:HEAT repeat protein
VAERFRLTYLKSTGVQKSDTDVFFSSRNNEIKTSSYRDIEIKTKPVSPSSGDHFIASCSAETILKQAKADLKHSDPRVRLQAIRYFFENSFPSIPVSLLQEILSDEDPEIRGEALRTLIKLRNPVISSLLRKHLKDGDPKVRIAALRGMFQQQEKIDQNILLQVLSDPSPWVRRKVATLMGWMQIEGSLPILTVLCADQDPMVRKSALFSLTILYPDESENRLLEAMTDSDPDLRKWAKMTLEKIAERPTQEKKVSLAHRDQGNQ